MNRYANAAATGTWAGSAAGANGPHSDRRFAATRRARRERLDPGRGDYRERPSSRRSTKPARRPLEEVVTRHRSGQPETAPLLEIGEARAGRHPVAGLEPRRDEPEFFWPSGLIEYVNCASPPKNCAPASLTSKAVRRPLQRAVERGEPVVLPAEHLALEVAARSCPPLNRWKLPATSPSPVRFQSLIGEEHVAHPRELDARLEVVALLRPPFAELHAAARDRLRAVGVDIDPIKIHVRAVEHEPRLHIGPHRLVVLDLHRAAIEHRLAVVIRHVPHA